MTSPYFSATGNKKVLNAGIISLSATAYTFGCRIFISSTVGGVSQRFFQATSRLDESRHFRPLLLHNVTANTYGLFAQHGAIDAHYAFSAADNQWHTIFIVHDRNTPSPNNVPIVYVDRVTAVVTVVTSINLNPPLMPSAGAGYTIGARQGEAGPMRGFLQHVVWANALWTKAECDQFASAPGSVMRSVEFYYPFARPDHNDDYGGLSRTLSSGASTSGPTIHDSTASGGLRRAKLLRVGL